ncbi:hypothetical protein [Cohnella soli]|uniref:N-acetyltransferase domain-containing protein n=1 Tax=Cohnella soli TaxID=425005 RepID=A0ABW0HU83_9BACL
MRIVRATAEDAETLHALQSRHLQYDAQVAKIAKSEDTGVIKHSLKGRIALIAKHRGVPLGAIRARDRGRFVYIDALWVPDMTRRPSIGILLLLTLEESFPPDRHYQVRAVHGDPASYRVYGKAGYRLVFEDKRPDGLALRLFEKGAPT